MNKGQKHGHGSDAEVAGDGAGSDVSGGADSAFRSGVLPTGMLDQLEQTPPWQVVREYLLRGQHVDWVEGHAAESPAFRDVLEALRNDEEERQAKLRRRVVVPIRPRGAR